MPSLQQNVELTIKAGAMPDGQQYVEAGGWRFTNHDGTRGFRYAELLALVPAALFWDWRMYQWQDRTLEEHEVERIVERALTFVPKDGDSNVDFGPNPLLVTRL